MKCLSGKSMLISASVHGVFRRTNFASPMLVVPFCSSALLGERGLYISEELCAGDEVQAWN